MTHPLYSPFTFHKLALNSRTVMAPMTRCRAGEGDTPTPLMASYYAQRATAGLIITEGTPVSPMARGYLWTPGIYSQSQIEGWRLVTDAVHRENGRIFMQLWHVGRISHSSLLPDNALPESPTDILSPDTVCFAYADNGHPGNVATTKPKAMQQADINRVKSEFVQAAENAMSAGMDGVEIHGANGYLFDQFLNSVINTRHDQYGGSVDNRCRFLLETVDAVVSAIGAERTGVRISPNGRFNAVPEDPELMETFTYLAAQLRQRKIAFLHVNDQGTFGLPGIPQEMLRSIRESFDRPLMVCGGYDASKAEAAIDSGLADQVAFGVPFLANPDLPARLQNQWALNEADRDTFYGGAEKGYTDYPTYHL